MGSRRNPPMRTHPAIRACSVLLLSFITTHLLASSADTAFAPMFRDFGGSGAYEGLQSNGKIYIAGYVSFADTQPCIGVARLNLDGTRDTNFNTNVGGTI